VETELIAMIHIVICRKWPGQPGSLQETAPAPHAYHRPTGYSTPVLEGSAAEAPVSFVRFPVARSAQAPPQPTVWPHAPTPIAKRIFPVQDAGKPPAGLTIAPNSVDYQPPAFPVRIPSQPLDEHTRRADWPRGFARRGERCDCIFGGTALPSTKTDRLKRQKDTFDDTGQERSRLPGGG
jgi:hypothetical protein